MAYISAEETKQMKIALKREFPNLKFSVRTHHNSSVQVEIKEGNVSFVSKDRSGIEYSVLDEPVNHFWFRDHYNKESAQVLEKIINTCYDVKKPVDMNAGNPHADYCDCTYYFNISISSYKYKKAA